MEDGHTHEPDETIESIVEPFTPIVTSNALLQDVLPTFFESRVILVMENEHPFGILTKIDVLDFMARSI